MSNSLRAMYFKWILRVSAVLMVLLVLYLPMVLYFRASHEKALPGGYRLITHAQARGIWSREAMHETHQENGLAVSGLVTQLAVRDGVVLGYISPTEPSMSDPDPKSGWFVLDTRSHAIEHGMTRDVFDSRVAGMGIKGERIDFVSPRAFDDSEFAYGITTPAP